MAGPVEDDVVVDFLSLSGAPVAADEDHYAGLGTPDVADNLLANLARLRGIYPIQAQRFESGR